MGHFLLALALVASSVAAPAAYAQRTLAAAPTGAEPRFALVIGNGAYKEAPLRNPVNDANDVAAALRELGFAVTLRTNATHREMEEAIQQFGLQIRRGGVGLFFFAGHGIQSRGANYLVPINANVQSEADLKFQSVDAGWVLAQMEEARNRVNIVVLDACRNNPYGRSFRGATRGLAQMDAAQGSFLAYATAPGDVAQDGGGRNGTYTKHLLRSLKQPESDIFQVFSRVTQAVAKETGSKQVPWFNSSLTGRFQFQQRVEPVAAAPAPIAAAPALVAAAPATAESAALFELAFWDSIKTSTTRADFEEYLRQYPQGRFAVLAHNRLKRLKPAEPAPVAPAERPDIKVGNQWTYRVTDRYTGEARSAVVRVATVTGDQIHTSSTPSALAVAGAAVASEVIEVWDRNWNLLKQGAVEFTPFYPSFQFPLETGKRWSGSVEFITPAGDSVRHHIDARVVGWEQVTVPAGTFDAARITLRGAFNVSSGGASGGGTISDTVWYAPALGQIVKKEIEQHGSAIHFADMMNRNARYERWELTEYRPN